MYFTSTASRVNPAVGVLPTYTPTPGTWACMASAPFPFRFTPIRCACTGPYATTLQHHACSMRPVPPHPTPPHPTPPAAARKHRFDTVLTRDGIAKAGQLAAAVAALQPPPEAILASPLTRYGRRRRRCGFRSAPVGLRPRHLSTNVHACAAGLSCMQVPAHGDIGLPALAGPAGSLDPGGRAPPAGAAGAVIRSGPPTSRAGGRVPRVMSSITQMDAHPSTPSLHGPSARKQGSAANPCASARVCTPRAYACQRGQARDGC